MLCYVGKATKIFFFLVAVVAAVGLFLGLGLLHHTWASHKAARPNPPAPCQAAGGPGPCSTVTSFPDPATAAAVPPPPAFAVPPPASMAATAPPPLIMSPPAPVPPTATIPAPPLAAAPSGPVTGASGPGPT